MGDHQADALLVVGGGLLLASVWLAFRRGITCATALSTSVSHLGGIPLGVFGVLYFAFWTMNLREFHRTAALVVGREVLEGPVVARRAKTGYAWAP